MAFATSKYAIAMFAESLRLYVLILVVMLCVTNSNSTLTQVGEIDVPHCQDPQLQVAVFKLSTLSTSVQACYGGMRTERKLSFFEAFRRYDQTYACLFTEQSRSTPVENRIYLTQVDLVTSAQRMVLESVQMPGYFATNVNHDIEWRSNIMRRDYDNNGDVFRIVEGNEMVGVIFFRKRSLRIPHAKGCRFTVRWLNGNTIVNTKDAVFSRTSENGVPHANHVEEHFLIRGKRTTSPSLAHTLAETRTLPHNRPAPVQVPHELGASATLPRNPAALHTTGYTMINRQTLSHKRATPQTASLVPLDSEASETLSPNQVNHHIIKYRLIQSQALPRNQAPPGIAPLVPFDSEALDTLPRNRATPERGSLNSGAPKIPPRNRATPDIVSCDPSESPTPYLPARRNLSDKRACPTKHLNI